MLEYHMKLDDTGQLKAFVQGREQELSRVAVAYCSQEV
jgi:hypothetical protein